MKGFRRILAATDFSPASSRALARAIELARANRAELVLAHVLAPIVPIVGDGYVSPSAYAGFEDAARRAGQRRLAAVAARAARAGVRAKALILSGIPAEEIARAARRHRADVIVMGTHGRSGLSRVLLGSVAQRVLVLAPCAVLTVRGR